MSSAEERFERAYRAAEAGRYDEAEALYREEVEAGNTTAAYNLAELLTRLEGREADAEAACHAAVAAGDPDAWALLGWLLEEQDGRLTQAEDAWRAAVDADVEDARSGLTRVLLTMERYAEAEATVREALELGEEEAILLFVGVLVAQGRRDAVEPELQALVASGVPGAEAALNGWRRAGD